MKRVHSPLSENTIRRVIDEGENFSSEDSFLNDNDSEVNSSSSVADDTDNDPTYCPDQPGPSSKFFRTVSSNNSKNKNVRTTLTKQPRRRPKPKQKNNNPSANDDSNDEGWVDVTIDNDPGYVHPFTFLELPGLKHCPPMNAPAVTYFRLFFTVSLLEIFTKYTNMYAEKAVTKYNSSLGPNNSLKTWLKVTTAEIQAFICILINMGLNRKPTFASYWWKSNSQNCKWFGRMMSRNRFQDILAYFHMVDTQNLPKPNQPNYDPCARMQPLIDHMNRVSKHHYSPNKFLSVDESIIPTKSYNPLRQYLPKKHHRFGIKLWVLCDAVTHYCLHFFVYKGAKNTDREIIQEKGLGYNVVMKLLDIAGCLNKGFHLFVDNFFTSIRLAKALYTKCTHLTGTVRMNRKGVPEEIKTNYTIGQRKYKRKDAMLLLGYRQRKSQKNPVMLLSTAHKAGEQQKSKKRGNKVFITSKPKIIRDYNDFMGGVDGNDQMVHAYMGDRRSAKFWKKITFNLLSRMILNSYILYKQNTTNPSTRLKFLVTLVDSLSAEWFDVKEQRRPIPDNDVSDDENQGGGDAGRLSNFFEKLPNKKERNCCECSAASTRMGGKRKKSSYICKKCKKGLHTKCFPLHKC